MGTTEKSQSPRIFFGAGMIREFGAALARVAPPLSAVLMISDAATRERTGRIAEKSAAASGMRVRVHLLSGGESLSTDCMAVPEDTKAVVAVGGGDIEAFARRVSARYSLPFVFVAAAPDLTGVCAPFVFGLSGAKPLPPPAAVICDTDLLRGLPAEDLAAAFGELASKAIGLFDYLFAHCVGGAPFCADSFRLAGLAIDSATAALTAPVSQEAASALIANGSLKYAAAGSVRLPTGGEAQTARALRFLMRREDRIRLQKGTAQMRVAARVLGIYQTALSCLPAAAFVPPPDNNKRLDALTEFCGVPEYKAAGTIRPLISQASLKTAAYRMRSYRAELQKQADIAARRLQKSVRIWRRLCPEAHLAALESVEPADIALALCLAPDLSGSFSLLSFLKDAGLLEEQLSF